MKKLILLTILFIKFSTNTTFAQLGYFFDDFDEYIPGQQLSCQNPIDWTTWSNLPCSAEDPILSTNYAHTNPNSVLIVYGSDLIKPLGNITNGRSHILFNCYIPSGRTGYFALLSRFTPDPYEWGVECFFDPGGIGRLVLGSSDTVYFNYQDDYWQFVELIVDLDIDEAQFSINYLPIYIWQWSQNGTITSQLSVQNFFGENSLSEMYLDNYLMNDFLIGYPPNTPSNLSAQQIFNSQPNVQLNWQDNSWNEYGFKIIRKNGLPNSTNSYFIIDTVYSNINQYIDSNVTVDSTYTYGIIAFNIYGNSDTSNFATIFIDPVTTLNEENKLTLFSLDQNYPNPFNPTTNFEFRIAEFGFVSLKVYDVLGNEVAKLVNEEKPAGEYEVEFTVGQDSSPDIASGIYFYQLKVGAFNQTKKMILLK